MPTGAVQAAAGVIASSVRLLRAALTVAILAVDLAVVSMTASACRGAPATTAGLRRVVLVVAVTTVVSLRAATVKVLAASLALVSRPVAVLLHGMKEPPRAVISRRVRSHRSPNQVQASRLSRTTHASAQRVLRADRSNLNRP